MDSEALSDALTTLLDKLSESVNREDFEEAAKLSQELPPLVQQLSAHYTSMEEGEEKTALKEFLLSLQEYLTESRSAVAASHEEARQALLKLRKNSQGIQQYRAVRGKVRSR